MRIDWWTLGLQTVNVLILVALLARFLFRPVVAVMDERRAAAAKLISDAEAEKVKAVAARKFYIDYARKLYEEAVKTYPNMPDAEKIHEKISKLRKDSSDLAAAEKPGEKKD